MEGCAAPKVLSPNTLRPRASRRRATVLAVLLSALVSVQCVQDFVGPKAQLLSVEAAGQLVDTVDVGDTITAPAALMLVGGKQANTAWAATVLTGTDVIVADDSAGKLYILKPGVATVRVRPSNTAITDTSLHADFTLHAVVPRLQIIADDILHSIGDTIQATATALTQDGVAIPGVTATWSVSGLDTAATLLSDGRVQAVKNGDFLLRAVTDTATATRLIRVRQRVKTIVMSQDGVALAGGPTTLNATATDARGVQVAGATLAWSSLNPNVASINPATRVVTPVASGQATIAAIADGVTGYSLVTVSAPATAPVNLWMGMTSGTALSLNALWGFSATNMFATGSDAQSPILQSNGSTWSSMAPGQGLHGLWGTSLSSIFAVGLGGKILRHNGTAWAAMTSGSTQNLFAVWGASDADVFAVGAGGTILRFDGTTWTSMSSGTTQTLRGVWGTSRSDVYAVGASGTILRYNGSSWTAMPSGTGQDLHAVWGTSSSAIYAVGAGGTILRFSGSSWATMVSGTTVSLNAVWGSTASEVYVAAQEGMLRFDGAVWRIATIGASEHFNAVWGRSSSELFAVGNAGSIVRGLRNASIAVDPATQTISTIGNTQQLTATVRDAGNSTVTGAILSWSSSSPGVATVSATGLVTAVANGTTTVCATAPGGAQGCATIGVSTAGAATVAVTPATPIITAIGNTQPMTATARDAGGNVIGDATFTWSSSNTGVATVDGSGLVTAVADGSTTVCATAPGGAQGCTTVGVNTLGIASVSITPDGVSITTATTTLTATARNSSGNIISGASFAWTSLNPNIATVNPTTGVVTPVSSGQVTISASAGGFTAHALVTVAVASVTPVNLWSEMSSGVTADLFDVWGTSPTNVYAIGVAPGTGAGSGPVLLRFDGSSWTSVPTGITGFVGAIWGTSPTNFYIGRSSGILRSDGASFTDIPTPSNDIASLWGASPVDLFTVGFQGNSGRSNGVTFSPTTSGTTAYLKDLWGSSATNVWAVGNGGVALRWDGASWTPVSSGTTSDLRGLWGSSSSSVYAFGINTVQRFNGTSWSTLTGFSGFVLERAWGSNDNDIYAVGSDGGPMTIKRWNGSAITNSYTGPATAGTDYLMGIWGMSNADVFAVGYRGTILRGIRGATVTVSPPTTMTAIGNTQMLTASARDAGSNVVSGVTFTWSSSDEAAATVSATGLVTAVAGGTTSVCATAPGGVQGCQTVTVDPVVVSITVSPNGVTIGGATTQFSGTARDANNNVITGQLFVWSSLNASVATIDGTGLATAVQSGQVTISATADGVTSYALLTVAMPGATAVNLWAPFASGVTEQFNGIWGVNATTILAAGDNALMRQFNGTSWSAVTLPTTRTINSVWGSSASDIFAVGNIGTILRFNGTAWSTMTNPAQAGISGVWGSSPRDVFAVGPFGLIIHFDGTSWTSMTSNTSEVLIDVYGFSATDVFAVGNGGTVLHYNGAEWSPAADGLPANEALASIWGTSSSDLFGVSSSTGTFYRYNGTVWAAQTAAGSGVPLGVWGSATSDVYVTGVLGRVNRFNGGTWSLQSGATNSTLHGVWGTRTGPVWAVGTDGTILKGHRGATVTVSPATPALTVLSDTVTLSATARDAANATIASVTFTWSSDHPEIATVNATTGLVTAVANGSASICATAPGSASGCTTVTVTGFSAAEIEGLVQEASRSWFLASTSVLTAGVTSVQARTYTASWPNLNLFLYSAIDNGASSAELWNRTTAWQNSSTASINVRTLWEGSFQLSQPSFGYYGALRNAVDVLKIIRVKGITVRNASDTKRAEAMAALMQAAALSGIALNYDKGFAPNENTQPYDPTTFAPLDYLNRRMIRDSAIAKFADAVALATANSFTTPASWTNGNSYSNTDIVKIAKTMHALTLANYGRTHAEAATADWASIAALASAGINNASSSLIYVGDGSSWYSEILTWFNTVDRGRVSTRIARLLHPASQTDPWPASGNARPSSADARLGDGSFGNAANAAAHGTVVATASKGSQFAWSSTAIFPSGNGDYHQSNIAHIRYDATGIQEGSGVINGFGAMPIVTKTVNDLLLAEAHLRTGNAAAAAALINVSRTAANLPPVSGTTTVGSPSDGPCTSIGMLSKNLAASCTLWAYLIYEKEIELLGLGMQSFFEERRLPVVTVPGMFVQGLIPGTPREMPVPFVVLQGRGEELYSWGGTNAANSTPP